MFLPAKRTWAFLLGWTAAGILLGGCVKKPQTWNPVPAYAPATGKDFDLTWNKPGENGSPDDPEWSPQQQAPANVPPVKDSPCDISKKQPYDSQCSDQSGKLVQDTGVGLIGLACILFGDPSAINGHVDWAVASAHGSLGFLNFAEDWDYNLLLLPDGDAGLTGNNNDLGSPSERYIEVEFDSRELEDRFQTNWWKDFASLARQGVEAGGDFKAVDEHMHTGSGYAYGSIYGLFGLDCEHGCRSEFHPAYAVALQVQEAKGSNLWAIFARNSGDEGFCSHLDHRLDLGGRAMQVLLPYKSSNPPSAIEIKELATSAKPPEPGQWCPRFTFSPGEGEIIEIPLPPPGAEGLTEVVVQFTWPGDAAPMPSKSIDRTKVRQTIADARSARLSSQTDVAPAEERLGEIYRTLNPGKKSIPAMEFRSKVLAEYMSARPAAMQTKQPSLFEKPNTALTCTAPEIGKLTVKTTGQPGPTRANRAPLPSHAEKDTWDKATIASVCSEYKKYNNSENKLSAETVQKLEKLCGDKRL